MTFNLETLPCEIFLHGIFRYLSVEDLKNLRFASSILSSTVAMELFRTLYIAFEKGNELDVIVQQLLDDEAVLPPQIKDAFRWRLVLTKASASSNKRRIAMTEALMPDQINRIFAVMPNLSEVSIGLKTTHRQKVIFDLFDILSPATNPRSKITKLDLNPISREAFCFLEVASGSTYNKIKLALSGFESVSLNFYMDPIYDNKKTSKFDREPSAQCICTSYGFFTQPKTNVRMVLGILSKSKNLKSLSVRWLEKEYKVVGKRANPAEVEANPDPFHCCMADFNRNIAHSIPEHEAGTSVDLDDNRAHIVLRGFLGQHNLKYAPPHPRLPMCAWPDFQILHFSKLTHLTLSSFILRTRSIDAFVQVIAKHLGHLDRLNIFDAVLHNFQNKIPVEVITPICENAWTITWESVCLAIRRSTPSPRLCTKVVRIENLRHAESFSSSGGALWFLQKDPKPYGILVNEQLLRWCEKLLQSDGLSSLTRIMSATDSLPVV